MRRVDLSGVDYFGADIASTVIDKNSQQYARPGARFIRADLTKDPLPTAEMIMCRDCWVHLSFEDIAAVLKTSDGLERHGCWFPTRLAKPGIRTKRRVLTGGI
jgi:hypothetical protein